MSSAAIALKLLKKIAQEPYQFSLGELAQAIDYSKSGTHKLLAVLIQEGMVRQKKNKCYCLDLGTHLLGQAYDAHVGILAYCKPLLRELRDQTNETVSFGTWVEDEITTLYKVESRALIRVSGSQEGGIRPCHASAIGKTLAAYLAPEVLRQRFAQEPPQAYTPQTKTEISAILDDLAQVRAQGYALSDEEFSADAFGIGAPIHDSAGQVWAAISLGMPKIRVTPETVRSYTSYVCASAEKISAELTKYQ